MGTTGSVSFMFNRMGQLIIEKTDEIDEEELMLQAIEAGAADFLAEEEIFEVRTEVENFGAVRDALEEAGYGFLQNGIVMIPNIFTAVDMETAVKIQKLLDILEDDDDVSEVYHNTEFPDGFEG
jgi:transcriptional/translational regulatory protein YebC/TACO1